MFLNSDPVFVYSKKKGSYEMSIFSSEFIVMTSCCEQLRGLRHECRMFGIPVKHPSYVFGDNQSILSNSSKPHSFLKKKSSSAAYHFSREGGAENERRTTCLNTHLNPSNVRAK